MHFFEKFPRKITLFKMNEYFVLILIATLSGTFDPFVKIYTCFPHISNMLNLLMMSKLGN